MKDGECAAVVLGLFSWIGRGWMVPAATFGVSLVMQLLTQWLTGDEQYYLTHGLPLGAALLISGLVNAASFWSLYQGRWLDDEDFGSSGFAQSERESSPVVVQSHPGWFDHSFALINQGAWALILFGAAIWILLSREL